MCDLRPGTVSRSSVMPPLHEARLRLRVNTPHVRLQNGARAFTGTAQIGSFRERERGPFAGIVTGPSAPNRAAAQAISVESAAAAGARARPLILRVARSPPSSRLANSRSFSRLRPMEAAQRTTDRVLVTHAASAALSARARCCARSCVSDARAGLVVLSRGKTFRRGFVDLPACQHRARLRGMQHRHEAWGGRRRFSPQRLSRPAQRRNRNAAHASHVARVHHTVNLRNKTRPECPRMSLHAPRMPDGIRYVMTSVAGRLHKQAGSEPWPA